MLSAVLLLVAAQPDSLAALRSAQRAQEAFELRRGLLAPRAPGARGTPCDERIGRFCYWYDGAYAPPPREPDAIRLARRKLLAVLDSTAAVLPGDWWIAGQRVRYLVESDRLAEAYAAARDCSAERWWCEALDGFARHAAGDDAAADSIYGAALADMSPAERCRWTDLTPLLDGELRRRYTKLDCEGRAALTAHLWWLTQPLLSRAGNDRRVEHFARLTMIRMLEHAGSPWAMTLADDLRELTVRYGWPVAWAGNMGSALGISPTLSSYERQPAFHFLPDRDPDPAPGPSPWDLSPVRPHERYAPLYAKTFVPLAPDITVFRRGESTLVVVAYDLARDTVWQGEPTLSRAVAVAREDGPPLVNSITDSSRRGVMVARAPWPATLAGFEVTQPKTLHVGRARLALTPRAPAFVGVSDLLVFDPTDSLPEDLAAVLPLVHGPARVAAGGRIGIYWEVYGLAPGEPIETTVHATPLHTGLLRRVGSLLGLGKRRETQLQWHQLADPRGGMIHRAVMLDVSSLDPGRYDIAVTVAGRGREVMAARQLEIVRP